jgi:hypothetical protein
LLDKLEPRYLRNWVCDQFLNLYFAVFAERFEGAKNGRGPGARDLLSWRQVPRLLLRGDRGRGLLDEAATAAGCDT